MIPVVSQINAVKREVRHRKKFYPGLVERGRMTQEKADEFIAHMEAVIRTLEWVRRLTEPGTDPNVRN